MSQERGDIMTISERMKMRRIKLGLKAKDIASVVGVSESTYRDWEYGRKIQGEPYIKIADALDMSILELLDIKTTDFSKFILAVDEIEKQIRSIRKIVM